MHDGSEWALKKWLTRCSVSPTALGVPHFIPHLCHISVFWESKDTWENWECLQLLIHVETGCAINCEAGGASHMLMVWCPGMLHCLSPDGKTYISESRIKPARLPATGYNVFFWLLVSLREQSSSPPSLINCGHEALGCSWKNIQVFSVLVTLFFLPSVAASWLLHLGADNWSISLIRTGLFWWCWGFLWKRDAISVVHERCSHWSSQCFTIEIINALMLMDC